VPVRSWHTRQSILVISLKSKVSSLYPYPAWQLVQRASLLWMLIQKLFTAVVALP
jgi:hypothetical protein